MTVVRSAIKVDAVESAYQNWSRLNFPRTEHAHLFFSFHSCVMYAADREREGGRAQQRKCLSVGLYIHLEIYKKKRRLFVWGLCQRYYSVKDEQAKKKKEIRIRKKKWRRPLCWQQFCVTREGCTTIFAFCLPACIIMRCHCVYDCFFSFLPINIWQVERGGGAGWKWDNQPSASWRNVTYKQSGWAASTKERGQKVRRKEETVLT